MCVLFIYYYFIILLLHIRCSKLSTVTKYDALFTYFGFPFYILCVQCACVRCLYWLTTFRLPFKFKYLFIFLSSCTIKLECDKINGRCKIICQSYVRFGLCGSGRKPLECDMVKFWSDRKLNNTIKFSVAY